MSVACGLIRVGRCGTFSNLMCVRYVQEKRKLQTQFQTTFWTELKIEEKEKLIKECKERVQQCEELINKYESDIQVWNEMKDKGTVFSMHTIYYVMMMN